MKVKRIAIHVITNIALFIIACITIPKLMKKLTGKLYKKNIKKKGIKKKIHLYNGAFLLKADKRTQ